MSVNGVPIIVTCIWCSMAVFGLEKPPIPSDKQLADLMAALPGEIKTISCKLGIHRASGTDSNTSLLWDRSTGRINATTVEELGRESPYVSILVKNEKEIWRAHPEYVRDVPDTWLVQRLGVGTDATPLQVDETITGTIWIERITVPYLELMSRRSKTAPNWHTGVKSKELMEYKSHLAITYGIFAGEDEVGELTCELAPEFGMHVVSTKVYNISQRKRTLSTKQVMSDFRQYDGIFLPLHFQEQTLSAAGDVEEDTTVTLSDVALNLKFESKQFQYTPTLGSKVYNAGSQTTYRVGYKDPHSTVGRDDNDTRGVDAEILKLRATTRP